MKENSGEVFSYITKHESQKLLNVAHASKNSVLAMRPMIPPRLTRSTTSMSQFSNHSILVSQALKHTVGQGDSAQADNTFDDAFDNQ